MTISFHIISNLLLINHPIILCYVPYLFKHMTTMHIKRCPLTVFNFQENIYAKHVSLCAKLYSQINQGQLTSYIWVNTSA